MGKVSPMSEVLTKTYVLEAKDLSKTYSTSTSAIEAVKAFDVQVDAGSLVVVRGRSGSGKTTLLNMFGGLEKPSTGNVLLEGEDITAMDEPSLADLRRTKVGFIFQAFGLIPILTAAENVEVPLRLVKAHAAKRRNRAAELLDLVGLGDRTNHRPDELSGGEQQRVAIARALANEPRLLIADEPTGQLDSRTGQTIVDLIASLVHSENVAAVLATHDPAPLAIADRVVELSDGLVVSDSHRQLRA